MEMKHILHKELALGPCMSSCADQARVAQEYVGPLSRSKGECQCVGCCVLSCKKPAQHPKMGR